MHKNYKGVYCPVSTPTQFRFHIHGFIKTFHDVTIFKVKIGFQMCQDSYNKGWSGPQKTQWLSVLTGRLTTAVIKHRDSITSLHTWLTLLLAQITSTTLMSLKTGSQKDHQRYKAICTDQDFVISNCFANILDT